MARLVEPVLAGLRECFVRSVLQLPRQRVDAAGSGDVLSRATADVAELSENAASILPRLVSLVFTVLAVGLGLGALNPRYLLGAIVVLPLTWWTLRWYLRIGPATYAAERRALAERGRHVVDTLRAERTVRAYQLEGRQAARVRAACWVHVRWAMHAGSRTPPRRRSGDGPRWWSRTGSPRRRPVTIFWCSKTAVWSNKAATPSWWPATGAMRGSGWRGRAGHDAGAQAGQVDQ